MGCLGSKPQNITVPATPGRSTQRAQKNEIKLILLGGGESGKSTFHKQIKIIHLGGYTEQECAHFKDAICENVFESIKNLIQATEKHEPALSEKNKDIADEIVALPSFELDADMAEKILSLYEDPAIKEAFNRTASFYLLDSAEYFISQASRLADPGYVPTVDDILRCRVKTAGIQELMVPIENNNFTMVDVGGQRSERKKWIHCIEGATAVLFFLALSEYDLTLYEDDSTNRMHESLKLFDEICNSSQFAKIPIILFLNKIDIFSEKIRRVNITCAFPDYPGPQKLEEASEYIQEQFIGLNEDAEKGIFPHITCATNTNNIRVVFDAVKSIVIAAALKQTGF